MQPHFFVHTATIMQPQLICCVTQQLPCCHNSSTVYLSHTIYHATTMHLLCIYHTPTTMQHNSSAVYLPINLPFRVRICPYHECHSSLPAPSGAKTQTSFHHSVTAGILHMKGKIFNYICITSSIEKQEKLLALPG